MAPYRFALEQRFAAFEWFADRRGGQGWTFSEFGTGMRRELREQSATTGMRFTVHAALDANPLGPDGVSRLEEAIDFASDIGAPLVTTHLFPERGARAFAEALGAVAAHATAAGVRLALENTPDATPAECNAVFRALRRLRVSRDHVGLCLDIGHANLCPATRNDYVRFVDSLDLDLPILHIHAHENWGDRDSHLVLFAGPARTNDAGIRSLLERLAARGFDGALIFEQWPDPPTLLCEARHRLLALLEAMLLSGDD